MFPFCLLAHSFLFPMLLRTSHSFKTEPVASDLLFLALVNDLGPHRPLVLHPTLFIP